MTSGKHAPFVVYLLALPLAAGCAKPIEPEFYTRTPPGDTQWKPGRPGDSLRIGVGAESPVIGAAFIDYAANNSAFAYVGWVRPEDIDELDCQIDCTVSFEHTGSTQVHYCLGRLIANIYNPDHSRLLDRAVKFHEAMYTPKRKSPHLTRDGTDVHEVLRAALFEELIWHLRSEKPNQTEP